MYNNSETVNDQQPRVLVKLEKFSNDKYKHKIHAQ